MRLTVDVIIPTLGLRKEGLRKMVESVERHSPGARCIVADEKGPRNYAYIIRDLIKRSKADVVVWGGDSCEWTSDVAGAVRDAFTRHFPDTDGCCGLNPTNLPTIPDVTEFCFMAIGRKFWERFPDSLCMCPYYHHFWTDTELGLFAKSLDRFKFLAAATANHPLPGYGLPTTETDETHEAGRAKDEQDHAIRRARKAAGLLWGRSVKHRAKLSALGKDASKWSIFQNDPGADAALLRFVDDWFPNRYDLRFLEIGTCRGVSAAILAERGTVTTLDVCAYDETQRVVDTFAMGSRVTRIVGPPEQSRALVGNDYDLIFIDGMHEYEHVARDWAFCKGRAKRILFHDYCPQHPGVVRLVDDLISQGFARWECRDTFAAATMYAHGGIVTPPGRMPLVGE